jgi:ATP-dependent exoDNAse (exonuclease V) alpha subunit
LNNPQIHILPEFEYCLHLIKSGKSPVFVSGKAGTGKTTLIRFLKAQLSELNIAVLGPTGISALTLEGQTIHSFFGFPPKPLTREDIRKKQDRSLYENLDLLILDEISMVRADMMDAINLSLQLNRNRRALFGGVQVLLVGDLFQLPPVIASAEEKKLFQTRYASPYFFDADCIKGTGLIRIELEKVFRQTDENFISLLNSIRSQENHRESVGKINRNCYLKQSANPRTLTLVTTNRRAESINRSHMNKLPAPEFTYESTIDGDFGSRERLPAPKILRLREGAQVMFVRNDIQNKTWVNGTIGVVDELTHDHICVKIEETGHIVEVAKEEWTCYKYTWNEKTHSIQSEITGFFRQYPLIPAWAVTIHKSQGLTLNDVKIDLENGAFSTGQTYVALSRCRSIDGISLVRPIRMSDVKVDEVIVEFLKNPHWNTSTPQMEFWPLFKLEKNSDSKE